MGNMNCNKEKEDYDNDVDQNYALHDDEDYVRVSTEYRVQRMMMIITVMRMMGTVLNGGNDGDCIQWRE